MKTRLSVKKLTTGVLLVLCLAMTASQAKSELKIDSVYPTSGAKAKNLPVTISGIGSDVFHAARLP